MYGINIYIKELNITVVVLTDVIRLFDISRQEKPFMFGAPLNEIVYNNSEQALKIFWTIWRGH